MFHIYHAVSRTKIKRNSTAVAPSYKLELAATATLSGFGLFETVNVDGPMAVRGGLLMV